MLPPELFEIMNSVGRDVYFEQDINMFQFHEWQSIAKLLAKIEWKLPITAKIFMGSGHLHNKHKNLTHFGRNPRVFLEWNNIFSTFYISKLSPTWNEPWIFINCTKSRCSTIAVKHKSLFSPDLSILIFHQSCGHLSHFSSIRLSPKMLPVKLGGVSIPHICHFFTQPQFEVKKW